MKAKELAKALDVPSRLYRPFRDRLRELENSGVLYRNRSQRYAVPAEIHLVVGAVQVIRSGDAYLRPDDPAAQDVFVSARHLESAMDGDRVAVRIEGRERGQQPSGRVVKVLERARPTIVGRFQATRRFGFVAPLDRRIPRDVLIPEGAGGGARTGDVVVVRITQFADGKRNGVGEVEKVLGPMDAPGVDVLAILHGHGLPAEFPAEVEAAALEAADLAREPGDREDLTDVPVFTIDPADARDHDDALSLRSFPGAEEGTDLEVGIHIADVSHFVPAGSVVDLEALRRGTSVYLVDQVVPMLPHLLSSDLCSLREGEDRFALSLLVRMDRAGTVKGHRYARTKVRSRRGLHYEEVQEILGGGSSGDATLDRVLRDLRDLSLRLRERREERGSLDFDLPEARVVLDAEGVPVDIRKVVQLDSHRLIEDFMVLANELVARDLVKRKIAVPFRVHEPPPDDRMEELSKILPVVGHVVGKKQVTPRHLQRILATVRGRPEENLVSTVLLRAMSRARYDAENLGHFGLASKAYLHFTSPIRRYPDLVVHRVVRDVLLDGERLPPSWDETLAEVCVRASARERVAQQAERDSVEMKKIEYMRRHLGDDFDGTISGVTAFGFFVLLDRVFVDGLVHVSTLGDDYYTFVPEAFALVGDRNRRRFRVGDRVRVQVVRADKEERQIDFLLLEGGSDASGSEGSGGRGAAPGGGTRGGSGGKPPKGGGSGRGSRGKGGGGRKPGRGKGKRRGPGRG
jgi:ribonuclease R